MKNEIPKIANNLLLRDRAYEVMKEAIVTGKFMPGQELSEQFLTDTLGISKTPIRDALRQLQSEGFIKITPFKGAEVTQLNSKEVIEILQLRMLLEPFAAEVAAQNLDKEELRRLHEILQELFQAYKKSEILLAQNKHREFHSLINSKVPNQRYQQIMDNLSEHMQRFTVLSMKVPTNMDAAMKEYNDILQALESRDIQLAKAVMHRHVENVMKRFILK